MEWLAVPRGRVAWAIRRDAFGFPALPGETSSKLDSCFLGRSRPPPSMPPLLCVRGPAPLCPFSGCDKMLPGRAGGMDRKQTRAGFAALPALARPTLSEGPPSLTSMPLRTTRRRRCFPPSSAPNCRAKEANGIEQLIGHAVGGLAQGHRNAPGLPQATAHTVSP